MTTAGDQINAALRLIGQLAEGETPSPATSQDCLAALNQMLDSWNTERLSVYSTHTQIFTWPASQASRTIGPTGNFVGTRPVLIDDSTFFRDPSNGISYPINIINQEQYNSIALKTATSTYPNVLFVNESFPDMELTVYPVPTRALSWNIVSVEQLTEVSTLNTVISLPPGYKRAFKYCLACEIATEFGVEPPSNVKRLAMVAKRNIKRINSNDDIMAMPSFLVSNTSRYNIYSNDY
jgi:hypothetical protein